MRNLWLDYKANKEYEKMRHMYIEHSFNNL